MIWWVLKPLNTPNLLHMYKHQQHILLMGGITAHSLIKNIKHLFKEKKNKTKLFMSRILLVKLFMSRILLISFVPSCLQESWKVHHICKLQTSLFSLVFLVIKIKITFKTFFSKLRVKTSSDLNTYQTPYLLHIPQYVVVVVD